MIESGLWFFGNDEPIEVVTATSIHITKLSTIILKHIVK